MSKWKVRMECEAIVYADSQEDAMKQVEIFTRANSVSFRYIVAEEIGDEE